MKRGYTMAAKANLKKKQEEMDQLLKKLDEAKRQYKQLEDEKYSSIGKLYVQTLGIKPSEIDLDRVEQDLKKSLKEKKASDNIQQQNTNNHQ